MKKVEYFEICSDFAGLFQQLLSGESYRDVMHLFEKGLMKATLISRFVWKGLKKVVGVSCSVWKRSLESCRNFMLCLKKISWKLQGLYTSIWKSHSEGCRVFHVFSRPWSKFYKSSASATGKSPYGKTTNILRSLWKSPLWKKKKNLMKTWLIIFIAFENLPYEKKAL